MTIDFERFWLQYGTSSLTSEKTGCRSQKEEYQLYYPRLGKPFRSKDRWWPGIIACKDVLPGTSEKAVGNACEIFFS